MNISRQACFLLGFLGLWVSPVSSMEPISPPSPTASLEGLMSRRLASNLASVETPFFNPPQLDAINLLPPATTSLLENEAPADSAFSLTTENVGEPPTSSLQLPLFQF